MKAKDFRVKKIDMLCICLFLSIVKIHAVPQIIQQGMKILFLCIILFFLLWNPVNQKNKKIPDEALGLCFILVIPSFISRFQGVIDNRTLLEGILNSLVLYVMYSLIRYAVANNEFKRILDNLLHLDLFACTISLVSILYQGKSSYSSGTDYTYFFGNKFFSMYLFILLIGLLYAKFYNESQEKLEHKTVIIGMIALELFLSYWTGCSTTLVAGLVLIITIILSGKKSEWLRELVANPKFSIVYFILPGILALNMTLLIQIPKINRIITKVFEKSEGLTGRTVIYSRLVEIFKGSPIFGYGYNSEIFNRITNIGNAQNGLFQVMIDYGIVGTVIIIIILYKAFLDSKNIKTIWGLKVVVFRNFF